MSVNWTKEQEQVIRHRGSNLLVSAAAGSGKTAVLVERIIQMLLDEANPVEIDRLLVMTFTNAAAAEMRERIGEAISRKLEEQPDNRHLRRQAALVSTAQIMTIDSFCMNLIRTHFHLLDLDPSFRIGEEGELMLLQQDVMQEMLEEYYANGSSEYARFVNTFGSGKNDAGVSDSIMQVYRYAQSNPYPAEWMDACRRDLDSSDPEKSRWMQFLLTDMRLRIKELEEQLEEALEMCQEDEYLIAYEPMLKKDQEQLQAIGREETFSGMIQRLSDVQWMRLATIRSKEANAEKKALVSGIRDRVKKNVNAMADSYAYASPEEMFEDVKKADVPVYMLLELAEQFSLRYQEKKKERNLVDFNDLEHEALKVLIRQDEHGMPQKEEGSYLYTETADELSRLYDEILVDEYQDSNLVQEALIQALSGCRFGRNNVFMVGDVKQSIYRFRLARPELFLDKYHQYQNPDDETGTMIELHQNFRSRKEVLGGINDVFFRIMTEAVGNVQYTDETSLHPGTVYAGYEASEDSEEFGYREVPELPGFPELLVVDTGCEALDGLDEDTADYTAKEIEAKMIAAKIRELTDPEKGMLVWDKKKGAYRRAEYRDTAVLVRSTKEWMETILAVLMAENIPAFAESRTGYFNTPEVEILLSLLSVIDNPMQDIPLAAVLKSPIAGLSDEELAWVMAEYKQDPDKGQDRGLYAAVQRILDGEKECSKLEAFDHMLRQLRKESVYLTIHQLLYRIFELTGFDRYMASMPAGQTRKANLDMLVEKAAAYETTSYKGLFHFIRYIRNLRKYDTDYGEASVLGDGDNTVRIMSIHKSKGLEFPIVFLAGMGKKFNKMEMNGRLLIDEKMGIASDYLDLDHRVQASTLKKQAIRRKMELDNLGEELRILYVAMTRAKECLIMTGTDRFLEKKLEQYGKGKISMRGGSVPYTILTSAFSYLDWLLMSRSDPANRIRLEEIPVQELIQSELKEQIHKDQLRVFFETLNRKQSCDSDFCGKLKKNLDFQYPFQADTELHTKMSVSELKKQGQMVDDAESVRLYEDEELTKDKASGAGRGTAYHRALELLPFDRVQEEADVREILIQLVNQKKLSHEYFDWVDPAEIWKFLQSPLGQRMVQAQREDRLHKEQQFVIGVPAREMGAYDTDEFVIVQGIIDAYFEEGEELVLVDYKTDRTRNPKTLLEHYQTQLEYYARALNQMTGKTVREKKIYSLTLQQEIEV